MVARIHCFGCGLDRLVPFSCKGRGYAELRNMRSGDTLRQANAKDASAMAPKRDVSDFA